jgi:vitamin B12 transporter
MSFVRRWPALALGLLLPTLAFADTVTGSLRTSDGLPLPQVAVQLSPVAGGPPLSAVTGPDGGFRIEAPRGAWTVQVEVPGFGAPQPDRLDVAGNARLDIKLVVAPVREHVVVVATRGEAPAGQSGVSVAVLDEERIEERAAVQTLTLLEELPGVSVARAGGSGAQSSLFVRGGESRHTRILLDGIPLNSAGGSFDFGSALPLDIAQVELSRGAGSALYGTDALAGVLNLVTRRGAGPVNGRLEGEAGSFGHRRGAGATSGRSGRLDWALGGLHLETDGEQPNSGFSETALQANAGLELGPQASLRLLARMEDSTAGTPGPTAFGRADLDATFERRDDTVGLVGRLRGERIFQEARVAFARTRQLSLDPLDSGSYLPRSGAVVGSFELSDFPDPQGFQNDSARLTLGYRAELQASARQQLTAGVDVERETGAVGANSGELLHPERTNLGLYAQDQLLLGPARLTLGARVERNDSFGTEVVPRAALAWRLRGGSDTTTLRASAGAGIKEPTFVESFGTSFYARGNPDLRPERSRTYDVGVEQRAFAGRVRAEATLFRHDYRDLIGYAIVDFDTFAGSFVNVGETRAQGLELALEAAPLPWLSVAGTYTHMNSEVLASSSDFDPVYAVGRELLRRPADQGSLSLRAGDERVSGLLVLVASSRRVDSDFVGLGLQENPGYARLDARLRYRAARHLELFAAADNLLDAQYQEVLGYPAPGRALRAGLRLLAR